MEHGVGVGVGGGGGGVGGGGGGGGGGRAEAERLLGIAEKLLGARDLVGSKKFAERALESDPLLDGVDQILASADVLLAAQQRRVNNQLDWYSILGLDTSSNPDPPAIKSHYRRLALLLHPDRNKSPGADIAFKLVVDAYAVLSDPNKKSLFDSERCIFTANSNSNPSDLNTPSFWTACPSCCHLHLYPHRYRDRKLSCSTCRHVFRATELSVAPPIVPGTDMYFSSWGFFPLGFPGGPGFHGGSIPAPVSGIPSAGWKPFFPMFPSWGDQNQNPNPNPNPNPSPVPEKDKAAAEPVRCKKKTARKSVGNLVKKKVSGGTSVPVATKPQGININEEVKVINVDDDPGVSEETGINNIHVDLDATEELLGNLQHIPFSKEGDVQTHIP